jgi:hypothetical protein
MLKRLLIRRMILSGLCVALALVFGAASAQAARPRKKSGGNTNNQCVYAYKNGAAQASAGQMRLALESLKSCAHAHCGMAIFKECSRRAVMLEADIPSVVPLVVDASGQTLPDVQVTMDGEMLVSKIDGRAINVDPGEHEFVFKNDKGVLGTIKVIVPQGQRNRPLTLELGGAQRPTAARASAPAPASPAPAPAAAAAEAPAAAPAPAAESAEAPAASGTGPAGGAAATAEASIDVAPPEEPGSAAQGGRGIAPYILGGVGVLGVAGYGLFTYWGNQDNEKLAECKPDCKPEAVTHIKRMHLAGKIAGAVGLAALLGGTWLYLTSGSGTAGEVALGNSRFRLDVAPVASGGMAAVSGSF